VDEIERLRERLHALIQHQSEASSRIDVACNNLMHFGRQLDRIEQLASHAAHRVDEHSAHLSKLDTEIALLRIGTKKRSTIFRFGGAAALIGVVWEWMRK
jgi:hypothetical protein